jgi:spore coat polysaccharide biosynthesis predicted glycosyltransferase SpsG
MVTLSQSILCLIAHPMMNSNKLLIRTDASPQLGVRFVQRCLQLAAAWTKSGGQAAFVSGGLPGALSQQLGEAGCRSFEIADAGGNQEDAKTLIDIAAAFEPDFILLDGPRLGEAYSNRVAAAISNRSILVTMNDAGVASFDQNSISKSADLSAVILPEMRKSAVAPRTYREAVRILVDFRDVNPDVWTFPTLQVLSELDRGQLVVDCLLSHHHAESELIDRLKRKTELHLRVHRNADRLAPLADHADLAVVSAGASCLQLAHFGVPGIVVATSVGGRAIAQSLGKAGAMHSLYGKRNSPTDSSAATTGGSEKSQDSFSSLLKSSLQELLTDHSRRRKMLAQGQSLFDDQGPERLVEWLREQGLAQSPATLPFEAGADRASLELGSGLKRKSA